MQYAVKHNGATYILPVFTRGMKKKIDEVNEKIANPESPVDDRVDLSLIHISEPTRH